jgi:hypothetical protein
MNSQKDQVRAVNAGRIATGALLALVLAGCGGGSDEARTETSSSPSGAETETSAAETETSNKHVQPEVDGALPKPRRLVGTWSQMGDRLLFRFSHDGTFAVDNDSNLDEPYAAGTYAVVGRIIRFTSNGPGCADTWTWKAGITEQRDPLDDVLDIVIVRGGCGAATGTRWSFARIL